MGRTRPTFSLPEVIDFRGDYGPETPLATIYDGDLDYENPFAWRIEYRCVYAGGEIGRELQGRAMSATTEQEAILRLQKRLMGWVCKVLIYHVRPPASAEERDAIRRDNEELERIKRGERERRQPGHLGRGGDPSERHPDARRSGTVPLDDVRRAVPAGV